MPHDPEPQLFTGPAGPLAYCATARELLESFGNAVEELMRLHEQQFLLVVEGAPGDSCFDLLIHDAHERKQSAKSAYIAHLKSHGCSSTGDAIESLRDETPG